MDRNFVTLFITSPTLLIAILSQINKFDFLTAKVPKINLDINL